MLSGEQYRNKHIDNKEMIAKWADLITKQGKTLEIRLKDAFELLEVETVEHEAFDLITSRAVTNTKLLLELTKDISSSETEYLVYKGSRVFDEIEGVQHQLDYDIVQKNQRNYLTIKSEK